VLKRLPVLFVCENNSYAIHTHQSRRQGKPDIHGRAEAHGMPAERLDGNDVLGLLRRTHEVLAEVRTGGGPWFFEVMTYRWGEHVGPGNDYQLGYRSEAEREPWVTADPVRRLANELPAKQRAGIEGEVEEEIAAAFAFAEASPFPSPSELTTDIFKEERNALTPAQG
ncbi:MAG TPA: thiamine pyrophosphate-dependent enzyme, partial [Gemmataceae bacterium]|nr:thiamine pyrophosphate-dependent enzyme [Gemmataceae bacterium]